MVDILKLVGTRIREVRKAKRFSQETLADRAHLHFTYVGGVERGERNVSLRNLHKIAHGLGVPLEELLAQSAAVKTGPRVELFAALHSADENTVQLILDIAKGVRRWQKSTARK